MDFSEDRCGGGHETLSELRFSREIPLDDLVLHLHGTVSGQSVVSPPGSLALDVQVHLEGLGGAPVPVGLGGSPAQVDVEVPLGSGGVDLHVVLGKEVGGFGFVLGQGSLPGDLGLQPVSVVEGDLGGEGVVSQSELSVMVGCLLE